MSGRARDPRGEEFVRGVLARTSGSACGRALDLLPDLTEGRLGDLDRRLVQGHLEHCPDCRAVAVVLGWLDATLPRLALIDPGEDFTRAVLERTSRQAARETERLRLVGPAGLMDRVGRWWAERIQRPVFAMQIAYAATMVLVLLTATPGSPLRTLPQQALQLVQAGPAAAPVVGPAVGKAGAWVDTRAEALADRGRSGLQARFRSVGNDLGLRVARTADDRTRLGASLGEMIARAREGKLGEAGYRLLEAGRSVRSLWRHWWYENNPTASS